MDTGGRAGCFRELQVCAAGREWLFFCPLCDAGIVLGHERSYSGQAEQE